eukprot:TRINITY_DN13229_c0_g1_i1.p1 TRINITY_DN13229_c0_g1~~TRINITY_DN13229_c0_g1_i1.p1  ORF type:complete len:1405 (-),score=274.73 TRINITY_DN13229_c0_g1_i1:22-3711(-)
MSSEREALQGSYLNQLRDYHSDRGVLPERVLEDLKNEYYGDMLQPFMTAQHFTSLRSKIQKDNFLNFVRNELEQWPREIMHSLPNFIEDYIFNYKEVKEAKAESIVATFSLIQRKLITLVDDCSLVARCFTLLFVQATKLYSKYAYSPLLLLKNLHTYICNATNKRPQMKDFSKIQKQSQYQLQKARDLFNPVYIHSKTYLKECQDKLSSCWLDIIKNFWDGIVIPCLGQPPCQMAVVAVGYLGRGEMNIYSDIQFVIFTEINFPIKMDGKIKTEKEEERSLFCYVESFLWLLSFFIESIREEFGRCPGFSIDPQFSPIIEGRQFIFTPSMAMETHFKNVNLDIQSWFNDLRHFGMYNNCYICGSENGSLLRDEYNKKLTDWLNTPLDLCQPDNPMRECCIQVYDYFKIDYTTAITWREVLSLGHWWNPSLGTEIPSFSSPLSLSALSRPLLTFALTMSCYFEINSGQPLMIFQLLMDLYHTSIPYSFVSLLEQTYFILSKLRILYYSKYHSDTVQQSVFPVIDEEEWDHLRIITSLIEKIHLIFKEMKNHLGLGRPKELPISKKTLLEQLMTDYVEQQKEYLLKGLPDDHILMCIKDFPDCSGFHAFQEMRKIQFLESLLKLFTKDITPVQIISAKHGQQYLLSSVIEYLMDPSQSQPHESVLLKDGKFNNNWKKGSHIVFPLQVDTLEVYIKVMPECPGNGEAIDSLAMLLVGGGIAFSDLWLWKSGGETCIVLVSQSIPGISFGEALDKNPSLNIPHYLFSQQFLLNLFGRFEDCHPNNMIYEEQTQKLTLIDTERSFVESFHREANSMLVKTPIYCFDKMLHHIHPLMIERLLFIDPAKLVKKWVQNLLEKCKGYVTLSQTLTTDSLTERTKTIFPFVDPHIINDIFSRLCQIQTRILKQPKASHMDIFYLFDKRLGECYNEVFTVISTPLSRYLQVTKKTPNEKGIFKTNESFDTYSSHILQFSEQNDALPLINNNNITHWNLVEVKYISILEKLEECANQSIEDVLKLNNGVKYFKALPIYVQQRMVNGITWKSKCYNDQQRLLEFISQISKNFISLNLASCNIIDYKRLKTVCHDQIQELNLSDLLINSKMLEYVSKLQFLRKFRLKQFHSEKIKFPKPVFPSLIHFDLRNSDKLTNFELSAPKLEFLNVSNCKLLKDLKLNTPNLTFIGLDNCVALQPSNFWPGSESPQKLDSFSCKNTQSVREFLDNLLLKLRITACVGC